MSSLFILHISLNLIEKKTLCFCRVQGFGPKPPPVTYPGLNLSKIPVIDDGSMEVDADSPDAGIAPMGSLHRALPAHGPLLPGAVWESHD